MSLTETMKQIKKIKHLAEQEVLDDPRETLVGRLSRKRNAQTSMKTLLEQYRQELLRSAVFILVTGSGREEFMKLATETLGFFQADPDQFYSDIVRQVSSKLYEGKESSPGLLDVVSRVLENKALEVGITGYPMMTFRQEFRRKINTQEDFLALVKQIITTQVGTEVVGAQAVKSILGEALKAEHAGKTTPILLSVENADGALVEGLRRVSRNVGIISVDSGQSDEASVLAAMNDLRSQLSERGLGLTTVQADPEKSQSEEAITEAKEAILNGEHSETVSAQNTAVVNDTTNLAQTVKPSTRRRNQNKNKNQNS